MNCAFPVPPPFASDWFILEAEEMGLAWRVLRDTKAGEEAAGRVLSGPHKARAAVLDFYGPRWSVVDFEVDILRGKACVSAIIGPTVVRLVSGGAVNMYGANRDAGFAPLENPGQIAEYLRYFVGLLWAADGAFALLESPQDLRHHFPPGPSDKALPFAVPINVTPEATQAKATVLMMHWHTISLSELVVDASGGVEMTSEDKIAEYVPDGLLGYETPFRFPIWSEARALP